MTVKHNIGRVCVGLVAVGAGLALGVTPASAHHLHIDPPGTGETKHGYVGGGPLPEAADGNGVVTIIGPTAPNLEPTCRHGSQPVGG